MSCHVEILHFPARPPRWLFESLPALARLPGFEPWRPFAFLGAGLRSSSADVRLSLHLLIRLAIDTSQRHRELAEESWASVLLSLGLDLVELVPCPGEFERLFLPVDQARINMTSWPTPSER